MLAPGAFLESQKTKSKFQPAPLYQRNIESSGKGDKIIADHKTNGGMEILK